VPPSMVTLPRALRVALVVSVVLTTWTLTRPAWAAQAAPLFAPFCDDRGATAIALPPSLEASAEMITRGRSASCDRDPLSVFASIAPARARFAVRPALAQPASPVAAPCLTPPTSLRGGLPAATADPHRGVRFRIERPPRG